MSYVKPTRWLGTPHAKEQVFLSDLVKPLDLNKKISPVDRPTIAFLGFRSALETHGGRQGAEEGPTALRNALALVAAHNTLHLFDAGDKTEVKSLGQSITQLQKANYLPIILGGGHGAMMAHKPMTFVHISPYFYFFNETTDYHAIGIARTCNANVHFQTAKKRRYSYLLAESIHQGLNLIHTIESIVERAKTIHLSLSLDTFSASIAPGVSAPQVYGLYPEQVVPALHLLAQSGKVKGVDILELSPPFDVDHRTAQLGAFFISEYISHL